MVDDTSWFQKPRHCAIVALALLETRPRRCPAADPASLVESVDSSCTARQIAQPASTETMDGPAPPTFCLHYATSQPNYLNSKHTRKWMNYRSYLQISSVRSCYVPKWKQTNLWCELWWTKWLNHALKNVREHRWVPFHFPWNKSTMQIISFRSIFCLIFRFLFFLGYHSSSFFHSRPKGDRLDSKEQACMASCQDRYLEVREQVVSALEKRQSNM